MKQVATARFKDLRQEIALTETAASSKYGYRYTGTDSLNRPLSARVPFKTADEAYSRLAASGITVATLMPVTWSFKRRRNGKPNRREMAQLADQIAAQFHIGLTFDRIFHNLAEKHPNTAIKNALNSAGDLILHSNPPAVAIAAQKDKKGQPFFPITFINAFTLSQEIATSPDPETEEALDTIVLMLRYFAQAQRRASEIFKKFTSALYYPVGLICAVFAGFLVEAFFIVPMFEQIFIGLLQGKDTTLPFPTQILMGISAAFRSPLGVTAIIAFLAFVAGAIYYLFATKPGIEFRETIILKLPIFKNFFLPFYGSIFFRDLSMVWASEPNIKKRFDIVAETTVNPVFRQMAEHIARNLIRSSEIGQLYNGHYHLLGDYFANVAQTIQEAPGQGHKLLYDYAKLLEQDAEENLAIAIATLESVAFWFAAAMVFFVLIASYAPLTTLVGRLANAH